MPSSTLFSNRSSGRGGGPDTTLPSLAKTPLWHGQWNWLSSAIQRTRQPRCVQIFDMTTNSCPFSVRTYAETSSCALDPAGLSLHRRLEQCWVVRLDLADGPQADPDVCALLQSRANDVGNCRQADCGADQTPDAEDRRLHEVSASRRGLRLILHRVPPVIAGVTSRQHQPRSRPCTSASSSAVNWPGCPPADWI